MSAELSEQHCRPLGKETAPLAGAAADDLLAELNPCWRVQSGPVLTRRFESRDYPLLVSLAAQIGVLSQAQDHHPDMELGYGKLQVSLTTHSVGGLSLNDFILAARINRLAQESRF